MLATMLRQIMEERHITQTELAKQIGVTRPSINGWLNGSVPTSENIDALCKALNVERSYLQNGVQSIDKDETSITIPALDRKPIAITNETEGSRGVLAMTFAKEWLNSRSRTNIESIRIFNMIGKSMSPTFNEGDLLIVDTSINQINGNGVYILRQLGEEVVRRIQFELDEKTVNVMFDNEQFQNQSTDKPANLDVVGKVIFAYTLNK